MALITVAICLNAETYKALHTAIRIYSNLTVFSLANAALLCTNAQD